MQKNIRKVIIQIVEAPQKFINLASFYKFLFSIKKIVFAAHRVFVFHTIIGQHTLYP